MSGFQYVAVDDNGVTLWEREWHKLYNIACDYALEKGNLSEFLKLVRQEEEE